MPRRAKAPQAQGNRTDLNRPKELPVMAATGQAYGQAGAQRAAQQIVPMANAPISQGAPANQVERPPLTPLNAPGDANQSLFHGMDSISGGGGSEALIQMPDQNLTLTALGLLDSLGDDVSPQVTMIKNYLRAQADNGILQ